MATFVKGDVVVVNFPFSDLTSAKKRPALVVAELSKNDVILCQITSQFTSDSSATLIEDNDFLNGSLNKISYVKSNRVFTANEKIIAYKIGSLNPERTNEVIAKLISILQK
ncbi:MAG: type II toxin-antitoxin system PemK/MazF family toxin [Pseudanabaena sp.]|jgi:mRNA interferase MazF